MGRRAWAWLALVIALGCASSSAVGAPTSDSVHFTAAGDFYADSNTSSVLNGIAAANPDAMFALGDLSYSAPATPTEEAWCSYVKQRVGEGFPFELLSGNHESNGQDGHINNFSACLPNQLPGLVGTYGRQYYVDLPQETPLVRYVGISPNLTYPDGTWSYAAGSPRYEWTRAAIDQARQQGIKWIVVGIHKPCLSTGQYSCEPGADIINLMLDRKVDLVLSGHEHHYERTKQLGLNAGCPTLTIGSYNPSCVVDSDNSLQAGAGTVFLTIGTGGVVLRNHNPADAEAPYFAAHSALNTTASHGFGDFQVTPDRLDFGFVRTAGGAFSDAFSLVRGPAPANSPPTASFTATPSGLTVGLDGSASTDVDGTISSYAWSFGDGTSGTGSTTQHTYAQAGTYPVMLTVTDDDGATHSVTKQVSVTSTTSVQVLAADDFGRTVASGWGSADLGGAWSASGGTGEVSVSAGEGRLTMNAAGNRPSANLTSVTSTDTDLGYQFRVHKQPTARVDSIAHLRRSSAGRYSGTVRVHASGAVAVNLLRLVNGVTTTLKGDVTVPGLTYQVGDTLMVRGQATGTAPTQLRLKVWKAGTPQPTTWHVTAQDSATALQSPGAVGLASYLSSTDRAAPVTTSYDAVRMARASTTP